MQNGHGQNTLQRAGETERKYNTNIDKLSMELSHKQRNRVELEWYKKACQDGGI